MPEVPFPKLTLGPGTVSAIVRDGAGRPSIFVDLCRPLSVDVSWSVDPRSARLLGGQWEVAAYVESIGAGPEQLVGSTVVPLDGSTSYTAVVSVPTDALSRAPGTWRSWIYKVVAVVNHRNFGRITDVAALVEQFVVGVDTGTAPVPVVDSYRIEGRLAPPPSRPDLRLAGVRVRARSANGTPAVATTDADGRFTFTGLPADTVDVDVRIDLGPTTYVSAARVVLHGDKRLTMWPLALTDALVETPEYEVVALPRRPGEARPDLR